MRSLTKYLVLNLIVFLASIDAFSEEVVSKQVIDTVWSGHPVGFNLLTHPPYQFVAYYNAERQMVVASRRLDSEDWTYTKLPEHVVWDSHNYITMAIDDENQLHVSGNLHVDPLVYFRTERPLDVSSLVRVKQLVGTEEDRMTYPRFFRGPAGEFIYTYRDGSSGSGNQIYNVYDADTRSWSRLLDQPLTDGRGAMNAYIDGPRLGPDGRYHCVWVWRDTYDCATNHDVSYMRSADLRNWENVRGEPLSLPVTIESPGTIVDPVPAGGGLINGNAKLGFDAENRPVVTYHKYDDSGNSQVFNARWNGKAWAISQATDWSSRWEFSGGGSIPFDVRVRAIRTSGDGTITQEWIHWELGRQRWRLDSETLLPLEQLSAEPSTPRVSFGPVLSDFLGMSIKTANDSGRPGESSKRYVLRWETLGSHRDRPREEPWPAPSELTLYEIAR